MSAASPQNIKKQYFQMKMSLFYLYLQLKKSMHIGIITQEVAHNIVFLKWGGEEEKNI